MTLETVSLNRSHEGVQGVYRHASREARTTMTFSVFVPPHQAGVKLPVVWYLSGLTCTHANVTEKGEFRRACAELGLIFVAPDTSPRGADVMGHSMGGHGALTVALRNPDRYRAASAFSPIVARSLVPWGTKALSGYLGPDKKAWRKHDSVALIEDGARFPAFLVDCGDADQFLTEQLKPELLQAACETAKIPLTLRRQPGYDHSYYFISTFMSDHLAWHAARLKG